MRSPTGGDALAAWVGVLVAMGVLSSALNGTTNDAFSVPGTQSQRALGLLAKRFPGTGGATARIVFAAPKGHTFAEERYRDSSAPASTAR